MKRELLSELRKLNPLIHNITNYVVMNWTANCLLALGSSPVMAHAEEEVEEIVSLSHALVVNIGTLSSPWISSMVRAQNAAKKRGIPIVLDPVGAGVTTLRTQTVQKFLEETPPTVLRGNAAEILALAGERGNSKGVDSLVLSNSAVDAAKMLSQKYSCVVCVSGPQDYIVGKNTIIRISNGSSVMARVTGMGCSATGVIAAFCALDISAEEATHYAMTVMGVAGEKAEEKSRGPGSFAASFLDALYHLDDGTVSACQRSEKL